MSCPIPLSADVQLVVHYAPGTPDAPRGYLCIPLVAYNLPAVLVMLREWVAQSESPRGRNAPPLPRCYVATLDNMRRICQCFGAKRLTPPAPFDYTPDDAEAVARIPVDAATVAADPVAVVVGMCERVSRVSEGGARPELVMSCAAVNRVSLEPILDAHAKLAERFRHDIVHLENLVLARAPRDEVAQLEKTISDYLWKEHEGNGCMASQLPLVDVRRLAVNTQQTVC